MEATEITIEGGTTDEPLIFYHRDGLDCYEFINGNPLFRDHEDFLPRQVWVDKTKKPSFQSSVDWSKGSQYSGTESFRAIFIDY